MLGEIDFFVSKIYASKRMVAFTGAGISVESGIPSFRGESGIWDKYDSRNLDIEYFYSNPDKAWSVIKELFYDNFGKAKPNIAHKVLGLMQQKGFLKSIITQNIDNLHQEGGALIVHEFHGNSKYLVCTKCGLRRYISEVNIDFLPVLCEKCNSLLKPDFVFFGEGIPREAYEKSFNDARNADLLLVVGSTGEVMPAALIPSEAKRNGAFIVEINPQPSNFTNSVTDLFIKGKAGEVLLNVAKQMGLMLENI